MQVAAYDCDGLELAAVDIGIQVGDINDHSPWFDPKEMQIILLYQH